MDLKNSKEKLLALTSLMNEQSVTPMMVTDDLLFVIDPALEPEEVDFLLAEDNEPLLLIEAKLSDPQPSPALLKFQTTLKIPAVQLINQSGGYRLLSNDDQQILIAPSWQWLSTLP